MDHFPYADDYLSHFLFYQDTSSYVERKQKDDQIVDESRSNKQKQSIFRITRLSEALISGYIHQITLLNIDIPIVIQVIITKYFNLLFIKLNNPFNEHLRYASFHRDVSFRSIAIALQKEVDPIDHIEVDPRYAQFINIWIKYGYLKQYYTLKNHHQITKRMKSEQSEHNKILEKRAKKRKRRKKRKQRKRAKSQNKQDQLQDQLMDDNDIDDRLVEIPDDFKHITLNDIDQRIDDKNEIIMLEIEIYDTQKNEWPFGRNHYNDVERRFYLNRIQIGDIIEVKDEMNEWYQSVVKHIEYKSDSNNNKLQKLKSNDLLYIHYIGWDDKYDQKIDFSNLECIDVRGMHTKTPHRPKVNHLADLDYFYSIELSEPFLFDILIKKGINNLQDLQNMSEIDRNEAIDNVRRYRFSELNDQTDKDKVDKLLREFTNEWKSIKNIFQQFYPSWTEPEEEFEDNEGNVFKKSVFDQLRRQGVI